MGNYYILTEFAYQNLVLYPYKEVLAINANSMTETKYCNHCGRVLDFWDLQEDLTIHKDNLGYGTQHDGDSVHLQLCCDCFDKLVGECAIDPITERDSGA